ncbi:MAG TPA: hypothetical protein VN606_02550 [Thermoleophilaceae bacterium]|nr:hypothetical protein [Thermoleophilaceae bacterium]
MSPSGVRAAFELERFEVTDENRLEVTGRWSGVRGLRFMRPSLTVRTEDGERNLLAVLEHKPWAAEEGGDWTAAFPWQGDSPDPGQIELAVAPSVVVELAPEPPARPGKKPSVTQRYERERLRSRRLEEEAAELRETTAALQANRDQLLAEHARLKNELSVAGTELATARRERDEAIRERDRLREELAETTRARDAAEAGQAAAAAKVTEETLGREAGLEQVAREQHEQIQQLTRERDAALRQREKTRRELEQAALERDAAVDERNDALTRRLSAEAERDSALGRGTGAPLVEPATAKRGADWLVRGLAAMAIVTFFLLVVVILGHA